MMQNLEPVPQGMWPDRVLVYGDTNSTLAVALVAAKLHIPVAHVEAGLRSFNRAMPEEINRIVSEQLSDTLFASTRATVDNLRGEGVADERVFSGRRRHVRRGDEVRGHRRTAQRTPVPAGVELKRYVLATVHRAENTDDPARLANIVSALETVAAALPVVLPLHPRTQTRMKATGLAFEKVQTVPPVGYLDMVALESQAALIATEFRRRREGGILLPCALRDPAR
jgi:UDP-GlcNAc3NAcA epimerase